MASNLFSPSPRTVYLLELLSQNERATNKVGDQKVGGGGEKKGRWRLLRFPGTLHVTSSSFFPSPRPSLPKRPMNAAIRHAARPADSLPKGNFGGLPPEAIAMVRFG